MARTPSLTSTGAVEVEPPKHATAWASLVYVIATMTLAYPALGGGFLINLNSDQYKAGYQFRDFAAQSLRSGHGFPLWNPYLMGGLPYVGGMHGDIFYPTFLLRMIMPTDLAMTWEFPIHLFLCGLFTYLFLRAWRFGFYPALIGGLAYMLGGSIAGTASPGHDGKLFVSAMLPLMLLLITRGIRDGRLWAWGAAALTVGLAVLSPHPQALQYFLLVAGAFALYVAFARQAGFEPLPRKTAMARLGLSLVSVVVGLAIGAVQFMPLLIEYMKWSPRAGGHDFAEAASFSYPIEETLNWYLPQFSGILDKYWGRNGVHFHSDYFGVVVLILAGAVFGQTDQKNFRRFWIGVTIVSLIWAFGGNTTLFPIILALVPGTKYFRAPSVIIFVTAFAVAVLAGMGAERILARRVGARYAIGWAAAGLLIALLMSAGGYRTVADAVVNSFTSQYPPQYQSHFSDLAASNTGDAILGAWRSCVFVLIAAGIIWGFATDKLNARQTIIALAVATVVDLWTIERLYWIFSPRASVTYASDPAIDAINKLEAQPGGLGRVLTLGEGANVNDRDAAFGRDALWTHDLRLVDGYHGNEMYIYQRLLHADSNRVIFNPQFWRHENVKYLYTGIDGATMSSLDSSLHLPNGHITKIGGPVRDAAGSMVYSYELPGANPTAWIASAMVKAGEDQAFATILDPRFDPDRVAIIDSATKGVEPPALTALPAPAAQHANVTSAPAGAYDITLDQPSTPGEALVVSDNYFPTWTATANGAPAVVARTDYNLIGVVLPPGTKTVQLRFTDPAYEKGKVITLVAIAAAVIAWIAGFAMGRARRTEALSAA